MNPASVPVVAPRGLRGASAALLFAVLFAYAPAADAQWANTPYGTAFGQNRVNYETFDFWKYTSPHFDVYYYPEEERHLDEVVAFAEHAYAVLARKMNHELSERMPIIFYQTHSEFQQQHVLPFFLPEGVAAFAEPTQNRLVLPVDDPPDELRKLILHEVTHLFEFDYFFGSRLGGTLRAQPPGWVMEGFAEHVTEDLTSLDEMMLRDVVLSDDIPTLIQMTYNRGFFVDYVLGAVVWDYIREEYGEQGVQIFLSEIRRDLGQDIERDLERAFNVTPQQFNDDFRQWLRGRYLPNVLERQEAADFARNIMVGIPMAEREMAFSPAVSPDGSKFAAVSVDQRALNIDIFTFDLATGVRERNLTGGKHDEFEYVVAQGVTVGMQAGSDLSWSPDGETIAFFGRTPPTRTLWLVDAESGRTQKKFRTDLDQALSPSIGPDGRVVFGAHRNGVRDIWLYDPRDDALVNLTQDEFYDYAPIWSPDGRSIVFASHVLGHKKLFRIDLARPQERVQLTFGLSDDLQPYFSRDGSEVFFISDRGGSFNLYGIELATETVTRYTNILHGAFYPIPVPGEDRRLMFSSYSEGNYDLFTMPMPEPVEQFAAIDDALPDEEVDRIELEEAAFAEVELNDQNRTQSAGGGWHISNIQIAGGYSSTGTILANTFIEFEDLLGEHRLTAILGSVESQRNFTGVYTNQKSRWNWGALITSQRSYFYTVDLNADLDRQSYYELDGGEFFATYPFGRDWRADFNMGYYKRQYAPSSFILVGTGGELATFNEHFSSGSYMPLGVTFVGDRARFKEYGPFAGRRLSVGFEVAAPGLAQLNFYNTTIDFRQYLQVTKDSQLAFRLWGAASFGENPTAFFFGGLNQLRGYDYLQFAGSRAALANVEYRFPLIWELRGGDFAIRHIRGLVFLDVGTGWFDDDDYVFWQDGRLQDAVASFGAGFGFDMLGLPLWFFWAQRTDFAEMYGGVDFSFFIGPLF